MAPGAQRRRVLLTAAAGLALAGGGVGLWHLSQGPPLPSIANPEPVPPSAPRLTLLSPPGMHKPLEGLNLRESAMTGHWHWLDDKPGGTLAISYTHEQPSLKILHLPVNLGTLGYDLKCEVFFEHRGGHLAFLLPAGQARPSLVLDLYDYSGIEFIRDADWKTNGTTVARMLPSGRFLPLTLQVRPQGGQVAITVQLDGKPFITWEGLQSDLSLPEENYPSAVVNHRGPVLTLQSLYGAAAVRSLEVTILPEP